MKCGILYWAIASAGTVCIQKFDDDFPPEGKVRDISSDRMAAGPSPACCDSGLELHKIFMVGRRKGEGSVLGVASSTGTHFQQKRLPLVPRLARFWFGNTARIAA